MLEGMKKAVSMAIAMFMVMTTVAVPVFAAQGDSTMLRSKEVNTDELKVGDLVGEGIRGVNDTCDFSALKVRTTAPGDGKTQWVGIKFNPQCRAVINAKWHGSLEEGPRDIIEPILKTMPNMTPQVTQELPFVRTDGVPTLSATAGTKTSEQRVYTYGYGTPWFDVLTEQKGKITFSYDGTNARQSDIWWTSCWGADHSSLGWKWVVDSCSITSLNTGPSSVVWQTGRGNYHCDPAGNFPCNLSDPDGYYHSLYTDEDGHADGTSHCTYWYSGNIVLGPGREVLQGCS